MTAVAVSKKGGENVDGNHPLSFSFNNLTISVYNTII